MEEKTKAKREFDEYQKAAINVTKNAVVSAGAGSGKTTVLSERFLHLIQKPNGCNVDEILTLTFTKKATVEMSDRIYKVLKEKAPDQAANFYKANIKTLDSYCNSVAKLGAHLYGISPDFTQDEATIKSLARNQALPFILKHRDNPAIKELVNTKDYSEIANELFVTPIIKNSTIAEPIDFDHDTQIQVEKIVTDWNEKVDKIDDALRNLSAEFEQLPSNTHLQYYLKFKDLFDNQEIPGPLKITTEDVYNSDPHSSDCQSQLHLMEQYVLAVFKFKGVSQAGTGRSPIINDLKDAQNLLREISEGIDSILNYVYGFHIIKDVIPLLKEFQEIVNNIKRTNGVLSFNDISNLALCILRDHPDIRLLEKQKYKAIMIDEFQDNNSMQRDLLFLLAEKTERMEKGIPNVEDLCPEKLFFVGDEKQSIYIFRGADVSVFRGLSNDFSEGNLDMTTNYRSHPALIAAFNTIFGGIPYPTEKSNSELFNAKHFSVFYNENDSELQIPNYEAIYHEVTLPKDAKASIEAMSKTGEAGNSEELKEIYKPRVHFALYDVNQDPEQASAQEGDEGDAPVNYLVNENAEAEWVANKIKELISQGKNYNDCAILLRNYSLQPLYEKTFLRHGIPYNTETVTGFYTDGPVNDIMAVLRLCVYPNDTMSYAQILRSPFVNLSLNETAAILAQGKEPFAQGTEEILTGKSREIYENMQKFYAEFSKTSLYEPITESLSKLWYDAGYRYETMWNHTVEMYSKIYDILFEIARQCDQQNSGLSGYVDNIAQYKEESAKMENMDIPLEQTPGVHILTIHKSKGLEYDTVFLCGSQKSDPYDKNTAPIYNSKEFGITINSPKNPLFSKSKQYFFSRVQEEVEAKRCAELRRIVYVALTRAKNELFITNGKYSQDPNADSKFIPGGSGNVHKLFSVLEPVFNFYNTPENLPFAPFDVEFIKAYPQTEVYGNSQNQRRNSYSDRKLFIEELINNSPYDAKSEENIIKKEVVPQKYASPSKLHNSTESTEISWDNKDLVDRISVFPEINKFVYASIPASEWELHKKDPNYTPKPRFDFTDFGTIAHAYMEAQITGTPVKISNKNLVGLDNNQDKIKKITEICTKMAQMFTESSLGKSAIGSTEFFAEYEFRSKIGNKIIKGIMDLVFKNSDGTYTIVDYKTNQEEKPEIYYNQLACYRQAIAQMLGIENPDTIKCYLFYLRSGHEIDISEACSSVDLLKAIQEIQE